MNHTNDLLKKYIQKKKEHDQVADELYTLVKNKVSGRGLDEIRERVNMINYDLYHISKEFIEQFIIKD